RGPTDRTAALRYLAAAPRAGARDRVRARGTRRPPRRPDGRREVAHVPAAVAAPPAPDDRRVAASRAARGSVPQDAVARRADDPARLDRRGRRPARGAEAPPRGRPAPR